MCTGAEPLLLEGTAAAAGGSLIGEAMLAESLPIVMPEVIAATELSSLIPTLSAEAFVQPAVEAVSPELLGGGAEIFGESIAALPPDQVSTLGQSVTDLDQIGQFIQSAEGMGMAPTAKELAAVNGGGSLSDLLFDANGNFLGVTGGDWTKQLVTQGAATGLQLAGANMANKSQDRVLSDYNNVMNETEAARLAEVEAGMKPYTAENMADAESRYKLDNKQFYDANRMPAINASSYLGPNASQEVVDDYASKVAAGAGKAENTFSNLLDMKAASSLLNSNASALQEGLIKANMKKSIGQAATGGLAPAYQRAGQSGSILTGAGSLTSGLGNLMLASSLSK